ncbi:MAG: DUF1499 domain-containing protein [Alphaproteobacteria bacterium]
MAGIDLSTFKLGWRPNQYFAAPNNFSARAKPHGAVPDYDIAVEQLEKLFREVALAQPRVSMVNEDAARRQLDLVQRSALFKFPDRISVQFVDRGNGKSSAAIYSRSTYGIGDMGVNKRRVETWLVELGRRVGAV